MISSGPRGKADNESAKFGGYTEGIERSCLEVCKASERIPYQGVELYAERALTHPARDTGLSAMRPRDVAAIRRSWRCREKWLWPVDMHKQQRRLECETHLSDHSVFLHDDVKRAYIRPYTSRPP